jgi:hypothetical protein
MPDPVVDSALGLVVGLMRRKLWLLLALGAAFIVMVIAANGWTWTTAIVVTLTVFFVALFAAILWFWIAVFASTGQQPRQDLAGDRDAR